MNKFLPNPDFLQWLLTAIAKARRSIVVVNYLATLEDGGKGPVAAVANELVRAKKRGVKVEVVLEGSKFRENMPFYQTLRRADADVWMDTSLSFIHTKAVLIDDSILCVGSHNLSASALTSHHELSIALSDAGAIRGFHRELARMTEQRQIVGDAVCREGTRLAIEPLVRIKRSTSPGAYLLYLLIAKQDAGLPRPLRIDAAAWADELGFPASTASADVRIATMLELMDRKLSVVNYDHKRGCVTRCHSEAKPKNPLVLNVLLPDSFWAFGWHRRLSVEAIHHYFAGEAERQGSPFAPWWRLKRDGIAEKYGFQKQLVNRAQAELKKHGLLEIIFEAGQAPKGRFARQMNYLRQNPFYDRVALEEKFQQLSRRYPKDTFPIASRLLAAVCEDSDLEKMEALCGAVSKAGPRAARRALATVQHLSPNSTKRNFNYVQEMLSASKNRLAKGSRIRHRCLDSGCEPAFDSHRAPRRAPARP